MSSEQAEDCQVTHEIEVTIKTTRLPSDCGVNSDSNLKIAVAPNSTLTDFIELIVSDSDLPTKDILIFERQDNDDDILLLLPAFKFTKPKYELIIEQGRYPKENQVFLFATFHQSDNDPNNFENIQFIEQSTKDLINGYFKEYQKTLSLESIPETTKNICLLFYYDVSLEMNGYFNIEKNKKGKDLKIQIMKCFKLNELDYNHFICSYFDDESKMLKSVHNTDSLLDIPHNSRIILINGRTTVSETCITMINSKLFHWKNALFTLIKAKNESEYLRGLVWKILEQNIMNWDHEIYLHFMEIIKRICLSVYDMQFVIKFLNLFLLESNINLWTESLDLLCKLSKHRLSAFDDESIMKFYVEYNVLDSVFKILTKKLKENALNQVSNDLLRKINTLIGNCCVASFERIDIVLKLKYCDLAVLLMEHNDWNVRDDVLWAVSMILNGSHDQIHYVLENKELLNSIICCLKSPESIQLKENALQCLSVATNHKDSLCAYQIDLLAAAGAHIAICDLFIDEQILNSENSEDTLKIAFETLHQIFCITFNSPITKYFDEFKENNGLQYLENLVSKTPRISDELTDIVTEFRNRYWDSKGNLIQDLNDPNSYWSSYQKRISKNDEM